MSKKLSVLFTLILLLSVKTTNAMALSTNSKVAKLNKIDCRIDSREITLNAYNVDGHNYFRIRDLCRELDYSVKWNDSVQAVWIWTNKPYSYELEKEVKQPESTKVGIKKEWIYINAHSEEVKVINIGGYNYFMLRDIQKVAENSLFLNESDKYFNIEWNNETNKITISKINSENSKEISSENNINNIPLADKNSTNDKNVTIFTPKEFQNEIFRLINIEREMVGVPPLELDPLLMDIATLKAREMIEENYLGHISPKYGNIKEFAEHYGYSNFTVCRENIHYGFDIEEPYDVVNSWVNSKGHYKNMISDDVKKAGIGWFSDSSGTCYYVLELFN